LRVADLSSSRELLWNLTLRELRSKYKRSVLGWAWSMLNPLANMLVYTFVFGVVLKQVPPEAMANGRRVFAFYLLTGLLPWNFLAGTTLTAMVALIGNAGLVRKVWFPREVLVLSVTGSMLVQFLIEMGLLSVALMIAGNMVAPYLPVVLLLMFLLVLFATGLGLALAAVNVYFRDLGYLWGIFTQLWFFATPIVYVANTVSDRLPRAGALLYEGNPMNVFSRAFRSLLYELRLPSWKQVTYLAIVSSLVLAFGLWIFNRLSPRFAEEL
jgi:ABC-2 type transport system permease protein